MYPRDPLQILALALALSLSRLIPPAYQRQTHARHSKCSQYSRACSLWGLGDYQIGTSPSLQTRSYLTNVAFNLQRVNPSRQAAVNCTIKHNLTRTLQCVEQRDKLHWVSTQQERVIRHVSSGACRESNLTAQSVSNLVDIRMC